MTQLIYPSQNKTHKFAPFEHFISNTPAYKLVFLKATSYSILIRVNIFLEETAHKSITFLFDEQNSSMLKLIQRRAYSKHQTIIMRYKLSLPLEMCTVHLTIIPRNRVVH